MRKRRKNHQKIHKNTSQSKSVMNTWKTTGW